MQDLASGESFPCECFFAACGSGVTGDRCYKTFLTSCAHKPKRRITFGGGFLKFNRWQTVKWPQKDSKILPNSLSSMI